MPGSPFWRVESSFIHPLPGTAPSGVAASESTWLVVIPGSQWTLPVQSAAFLPAGRMSCAGRMLQERRVSSASGYFLFPQEVDVEVWRTARSVPRAIQQTEQVHKREHAGLYQNILPAAPPAAGKLHLDAINT